MSGSGNISGRLLLCLGLSLLGFVLNCIAYYPGFMSSDCFDQYSQALTKNYHDWHPPIMAAFWSLLLIFHKSQQPFFFLQMLFLWISFYLLLRLFIQHYFKTAFLVVLFAFAPFIQNFAGVILKDFQMGLAWLLATAIMLKVFYERRPLNKFEFFICLITISYGCWMRHNALSGAIPLIILLVFLSAKNTKTKSRTVLSLKTVFLVTAIVICQFLITNYLIKPQRVFSENKIYMQDITGIFVKTQKNYFPYFIRSYNGFDSSYLQEKYTPATFDHIWWNRDNRDLFSPELLILNADSSKSLRANWLRAINENKSVYLKNRYEGFLNYLRIDSRTPNYAVIHPYIIPNNFGIEPFKPNVISSLFIKSIQFQENYFYMKPWFWAILTLVIIIIAFFKKFERIKVIILSLSLSSLFYLLPQFFIFQVDTDFRYFYWNCISISLAFILLVAEFFKPKNNAVTLQSSQTEVAPERLQE